MVPHVGSRAGSRPHLHPRDLAHSRPFAPLLAMVNPMTTVGDLVPLMFGVF